MEFTDTASKSTGQTLNKAVYQGPRGKGTSKGRITFQCLMTVKEQDSEVHVVHWWFTEGGDFILGALFCEIERIT